MAAHSKHFLVFSRCISSHVERQVNDKLRQIKQLFTPTAVTLLTLGTVLPLAGCQPFAEVKWVCLLASRRAPFSMAGLGRSGFIWLLSFL